MSQTIKVPVSPEQEDVLFDHAMGKGELGMLPDERHWMVAQARKQVPGCRVTGADLDVANGQWVLEIETEE